MSLIAIVLTELVGDTEPATAQPGTIRGDYGEDSYEQADAEDRGLRNLAHAAEDQEAAEREIQLWFDDQIAEASGASSFDV